jgi:hypothetical protein
MDSDENLIQLLHLAPFEIIEKIRRFTYKTQNKLLLIEIKNFAKIKQYLHDFTILIDTAHSINGFIETTENIHERLWSGLNYIRNSPLKEYILKNWKYKLAFKCSECDHTNENINFIRLNWETSFAVSFWMYIYH